jgi:hypothetical protein
VSFSSLGTPPPPPAYPAWGQLLVEKVEDAIVLAWDRVRAAYPALIAAGDEDQITDRLKTELVALRRLNCPPGFSPDIFQTPVRDAKVRQAYGKSIDPMPDLTFYLALPRQGVTDDQHDALFFECKVLTGGRHIGLYARKGLTRFVSGWYAAKMPHAGLIAYALDGRYTSPSSSLAKYFGRKLKKGSKTTNGDVLLSRIAPRQARKSPGPSAAEVAESIHGRTVPGSALALSDISLRHLWLLP